MKKKISLVSVIDDDHFFQFSTKRILESSEKVEEVLQFYDGELAMKYFRLNRNESSKIPKLIFLDLNMPFMDGWQFLDEFTANKFSLDVITIYICTSSSSTSDRDRYNQYPKLSGYMIKPISKNQFMETLQLELAKYE